MLEFVTFYYKDVETSHSGMSVGREIKVSVGPEGRKHLITGSIYLWSEILQVHRLIIRYQPASPDVKSSITSWHVTHEIEPFSIGRYCRMGKTRQGVIGYLQFRRFAPGSIRALRYHDGGISGIVRVGLTLGEIHRLPVGRETACSLVVIRVQF